MKNTMKINFYRHLNYEGSDESWQNCQFAHSTGLSGLTVKLLATVNGQPFLRQHHTTYLTRKETCHAHHFAKHLTITLLSDIPTTQSTSIGNVNVDSG